MTLKALTAIPATSLFNHVWPLALIIFGLGVTVVWAVFLGYGLVALIEKAI
jgi:hypothetical protein